MNNWKVEKQRTGPKAGKWGLINPLGNVQWYYRLKYAATRDCALMNSAEAMPVSNPAHASLITKLSHAEDDLLRALGLADVATEEAERLRARITELEAVIGDCLRDLIAMFPDEWNPGAPLLMHYTKYKLREALKGEAT